MLGTSLMATALLFSILPGLVTLGFAIYLICMLKRLVRAVEKIAAEP